VVEVVAGAVVVVAVLWSSRTARVAPAAAVPAVAVPVSPGAAGARR
jgi:O-acetylserine/cysteine efflux transporter